MGCSSCGGSRAAKPGQAFEVTCRNGRVVTVDTIPDVRRTLANNGGGTYRSVPKPAK